MSIDELYTCLLYFFNKDYNYAHAFQFLNLRTLQDTTLQFDAVFVINVLEVLNFFYLPFTSYD